MMNQDQAEILATELGADPLLLGYAPFIAGGNDTSLSELLNATTGPGAASVATEFLTRDRFLAGIIPALVVLGSGGIEDATQRKWDRIISAATAATGVAVGDPTIAGIFGLAITDGLLTSEQVAAITHRVGSRAEVLLGPDVVVSPADIALALRGAS